MGDEDYGNDIPHSINGGVLGFYEPSGVGYLYSD